MLTRVQGVTLDAVAHYIRLAMHQFGWRRLRIFSQHPKDPRVDFANFTLEIMPNFCHLAASALVREFRINKGHGDRAYDYDTYQMELWKAPEEYNVTLVDKLGNDAAGRSRSLELDLHLLQAIIYAGSSLHCYNSVFF